MAKRKVSNPFTLEVGVSLIAIFVSLIALTFIIENKPVIGGYEEIGCRKVTFEDRTYACIVRLDRYDDKIRVFREDRR